MCRVKKRTTSPLVVSHGVVGHCVSSHERQTRTNASHLIDKLGTDSELQNTWHTVGTRVVLLYLSHRCGARVSMVELGGIETPS